MVPSPTFSTHNQKQAITQAKEYNMDITYARTILAHETDNTWSSTCTVSSLSKNKTKNRFWNVTQSMREGHISIHKFLRAWTIDHHKHTTQYPTQTDSLETSPVKLVRIANKHESSIWQRDIEKHRWSEAHLDLVTQTDCSIDTHTDELHNLALYIYSRLNLIDIWQCQ